MNARDQYLLETQQRYLRFIQKEDEAEQQVRERNLPEKKRSRKLKQLPQTQAAALVRDESMPMMTMDRYLSTKYRVYNIILDSTFRDLIHYPNANDFVVKLSEPLKNAVALRLLRTEFYQPSQTNGYFVLNQVRIPIQLYNIESAYLYINGYTSTNIANEVNTQFFGRIGAGTEVFPAVTGSISQDPYIYVMQPIEPRLKRFHIKLMQADGSLYAVDNARVVITLAVYCIT